MFNFNMGGKSVMNIIFLDVGGVLNSAKELSEGPFSKISLNVLKRIVDETNAKIVVISSWRLLEFSRKILLSELEKYHLKESVIGMTPHLPSNREEEIMTYLKSNEFPNLNFIILDDQVIEYQDLEEHVIKIDPYFGLNEEHLETCIHLLTSKTKTKS